MGWQADGQVTVSRLLLEAVDATLTAEGSANIENDTLPFDGRLTLQAANLSRLAALADPGIVRHRGKIEATINNARRAEELIEKEGSLRGFFWRFEAEAAAEPQSQTTSVESVALSKDLKKRGWKFVGPTTMFALMEATGVFDPHLVGCRRRR